MMSLNRRIMFLRNEKRQIEGCVAIVPDRDNEQALYQLSVLNPSDRFNRKVARQLALGRVIENPFSVKIRGNMNMHEIAGEIMSEISASKTLPKRAIRAAKLWLQTPPPSEEVSEPTGANDSI